MAASDRPWVAPASNGRHNPIVICFIFLVCFAASFAANAIAADDAAPSVRPVKLFGRIEQLNIESGAKLPLKGKSMTPEIDSARAGKDHKLSAAADQSFPLEFLGTWSGPLTVISFNYDTNFFEFDSTEAKRQADLLKVGTVGTCSVTFFRGANDGVEMKPCSVTFAQDMTDLKDEEQKKSETSTGSASTSNTHHYSYHLHFGDLDSGNGVTGNEISCQLMKNNLKQLAAGQMEQEVITRDSDRNPTSGKIKTGYSESVLLFTQLKSDELYTQAASVSYGGDAAFQNKVILSGTLRRISK